MNETTCKCGARRMVPNGELFPAHVILPGKGVHNYKWTWCPLGDMSNVITELRG